MHNSILSIDLISFSFTYFCLVFWFARLPLFFNKASFKCSANRVFICLVVLFCFPVLFLRLVLYYLRLHPLFSTHWHTFVSLWPTFTTPGFHHSQQPPSLLQRSSFPTVILLSLTHALLIFSHPVIFIIGSHIVMLMLSGIISIWFS